jgi:hypothetical protein
MEGSRIPGCASRPRPSPPFSAPLMSSPPSHVCVCRERKRLRNANNRKAALKRGQDALRAERERRKRLAAMDPIRRRIWARREFKHSGAFMSACVVVVVVVIIFIFICFFFIIIIIIATIICITLSSSFSFSAGYGPAGSSSTQVHGERRMVVVGW